MLNPTTWLTPLLYNQTGTDAPENPDAAADQPASTDAAAEPPPPKSFDEAASTVLDTVFDIWEAFLSHLPLLAMGVLILIITWIVARIVDKISTKLIGKADLRGSLQDLIERLLVIAVWVIGLMLAAMIVFPQLDPADALAALGLTSVAIGFAFKDIFENFLAGILILWRFPFENGDFIECEGVMGKVEDITIRNTMIRTVEGELVIMPNATLFKNPIDVMTDQNLRRITVIGGVGYGEDVDKSRDVIRDAVKSCDTVSTEKDIEIFAQEFGASSINFEITWWTGPTPLDHRKSRDQVIAAVKRALDDADIEIPFPYRTLTFSEPLKMRSQDGDATTE